MFPQNRALNPSISRIPILLASFCLASTVTLEAAQDMTLQGAVFEQEPDDATTDPVTEAAMQFFDEDGSLAGRATTDSDGAYRVLLDPGSYTATAKATGYDTYATRDGYVMVSLQGGVTTLNFFLHAVETDDGKAQNPDPSSVATGSVGGSVRVGSGGNAYRLNFSAEAAPLDGTIRYAPTRGSALRGNVNVEDG